MTEPISANSVPSAPAVRRASRWVVVLPVISLTLLVLAGALQSWSYWRGVKSLETQHQRGICQILAQSPKNNSAVFFICL